MTPSPDPATPLETLASLLATVCNRPLPPLTPATPLTDLPNMDSLRLLETLALAEEHYGVEIDTRKIETIATVGDIIAALSP